MRFCRLMATGVLLLVLAGAILGTACGGAADGVGIQDVVSNDNGTITITLTNGSTYTTDNLTGPQGPQGIQGATGATGATGAAGAQGVPGTARAWAWVRADGSIANQGGEATITVTKSGTGVYCIETDPDILGNYGPMIATIQGPDHTAGFISCNDGWGSVCNPYGGIGIFTANTSGAAADYSFVIIIP